MRDRWQDLTLAAMTALGGKRVALKDLYDQVERDPSITAEDRKPWKRGGSCRYEYFTRQAVMRLVHADVLVCETIGVYSKRST
jgi:hypothetical protein